MNWPVWIMIGSSLVHCFLGQEIGTNYEGVDLDCGA